MNKEYDLKRDYVILFIIGTVILLFPAIVGRKPYIGDDAVHYLSFHAIVQPVYPLFLRLIRFIVGDKYQIGFAVLLQGLFEAFGAVYFVAALRETFGLGRRLTYFCYALTLINYYHLAVSISVSDGLVTNLPFNIMTETLALPLIYILNALLMKYAAAATYKKLLAVCAVLFLIVSARTQFISLLGMSFLVFLYAFLYLKTSTCRHFVISLLCLALVFCTFEVAQECYVMASGFDDRESYNTRNRLGHLIFFSEESDFDTLEDPRERELYRRIYDEVAQMGMDQEGYLYRRVGDSWVDQMNYYVAAMNPIYHALEDNVRAYVKEDLGVVDPYEAERETVRLYNAIKPGLQKKYLKIWMWTSLKQLPLAMGYSLIDEPIWYIRQRYQMAGGMVMLFFGIAVCCLHIAVFRSLKKEGFFLACQIIFAVGNSIVCGFVMRMIRRYVSCSTALFYIALIIACASLARAVKNSKVKVMDA